MKNTSILFIGNSFTYFNDMPNGIFEKICNIADIPVTVEAITSGGYRLIQFTDPENEFGKKVYEAFASNKYDVVIIQEQSRNPILNYEEFYHGAEKLVSLAKNNGANVYFYQTWGYKTGYPYLPDCAESTKEMGLKLKEAYCKAAKDLNCKVAPIGTAFSDVHENTSIDLYKPDLFHPSLHGSTLAAWVIFSTVFKILPNDVDYVGDISEEDSIILKNAATKAVLE